MSAIEVNNLQKTFQTKRKAAGLGASVRALFKPEYSTVEAVRGLSFEMESGELLGFIGPNGAGKSTTIKILTGILHPSGGEAKVLGLHPVEGTPETGLPDRDGFRPAPAALVSPARHRHADAVRQNLRTRRCRYVKKRIGFL